MEIDWQTFTLELLNFFVLVWILRRFLYRPVLNALARRREWVETTLAQAEATRAAADDARNRYEQRLAVWEEEKRRAREDLTHELAHEKEQRMRDLQAHLAEERQKAEAAETCRQQAFRHHAEREAMQLAARFAARLLTPLAGPDLEARLVELALERLAGFAPGDFAVADEEPDSKAPVRIDSAHPLPLQQRERLEAELIRLLPGHPLQPDYRLDPGLLAGLRITIGGWVLRANLADELQSFAELEHER